MSKTIDEIRAGVMRRRNIAQELRKRGDEASIIAAEVIEDLKRKTSVHIGFTYEKTGERINVFFPDNRSMEVIAEFPLPLQIASKPQDFIPMSDFPEE